MVHVWRLLTQGLRIAYYTLGARDLQEISRLLFSTFQPQSRYHMYKYMYTYIIYISTLGPKANVILILGALGLPLYQQKPVERPALDDVQVRLVGSQGCPG